MKASSIFFFFISLNLFAVTSKPSNKMLYGCDKPITLSLYEFSILYSDKTKTGVDLDFVNELKKESGCEFKIDVQPRVKIWAFMEQGKLDMTVSGISTPEREKFAGFANYIDDSNLVLVRDDVKNIKTLDNFINLQDSYKIGVVRAFKHGKSIDLFVDRMHLLNRVVEFVSFEELIKAFIAGNIKMMIGTQLLIEKIVVNDFNFTKFYSLKNESIPIKAGLVISKKKFSPTQIQNWQELVESMIKRGTLSKIRNKHLGNLRKKAI